MPIQEPRSTIDDSTGEHRFIADSHPPRVAIKFGAMTDCGKVRSNNEDHFLVARLSKSMRVCKTSLPGEGETQFSEEEGYLIVVADGMGGARSRRTRQRFGGWQHRGICLEHAQMVLASERRRRTPARDRASPEPRIGRSDRHRARPQQSRILWDGDYPDDGLQRRHRPFYSTRWRLAPYLFRDGELEQLTSDDTVVQVMVDAGVISPEDAKHHNRRHVVTNVIGGPGEGVSVEIQKLNLLDGDTVLYCTDGLTEPVDDHAIAEILHHHPDPEDACTRLVESGP